MSRNSICHALVLRTVDIGEADRFCVLLTRERGKLAASVPGARRPGSSMGGHLLVGRFAIVEIKESRSGLRVTSAQPLPKRTHDAHDIRGFAKAQQGMELLLRLLQDDEPLPEIFDATVEFVDLCADADKDPYVPYGLRLLVLLGLLPHDHPAFNAPADARALLLEQMLGEQIGSPMRSKAVADALVSSCAQ